MSDESNIRDEFDEALRRLMRRFRGRIDPSVAAGVLETTAKALTSTPDEAGVTFDAVTGTLHVVFEHPSKLEERLSEFVDLRALVVDAPVPMHHDVVVRVSGNGRAVELMGRVVQELPNGRCVQIDRLDSITETRLRALPDQMREPAPQTDSFERPETGRRPHIETPMPEPQRPPQNNQFERAPTLASYRPSARPSRTWELDRNVAEPLLALVANNATGMLELVGDRRRLILVDRGNFVDVASEPEKPGETLESLLVRAGVIDEDDATAVTQYRGTYGVGSSEALLNLGVVEWNELQVGLRSRVRFLLRDVWKMRGKAHFYPLENLPSKPLAKPVQILTWVFGELVDGAPEEVPPELDGHLFRPPETLPPVLATVDILPQHEDILGISFGAGRSVAELLRMSRSNFAETIVAIETLLILGFLEKVAYRPISRVQTQSVKQLDMLHARLQAESHFEIFGLHWSAFDEEVEERYESLKKKFDPSVFGDGITPEIEARITEVRARIDEAWKVLRSARRRRAHRAEVVDDFKVESSVQMFEQQADTAVFRHDLEEAVAFFSRVFELQPDRVELKTKIRQLRELM